MLRRVKSNQLRLGMFVETIDGNWKGKRFWRSRFLLDSLDEVRTLRASGIETIIINTEEGADIIPAASGKRCSSPPDALKVQVTRALETIEQSKPLIKSMFEDARMGNSVPVGTAKQLVEQIATRMADNSRALIEVTRLKSRDDYTFLHSIAVTALMVHLGRSIKIDEETTQTLAMGGLLHDIGKAKIPLKILNKSGPLTDEEMKQVRKHPQHSYDLLQREDDVPETVLDICLHHHERLDGKGYPHGLSGDQISLPVRMASICDVYDALTSKRAYKKAWPPKEAVGFMLKQEGQFDRCLIKRFVRSLGL